MMASSSRSKCINDPDSFCYVCSCFALLHQRRKISEFVRSAYKAYFDIPLGDQHKKWAPHTVCHNCKESLRDWTKGKRKRQPFGVPVVWWEPKDHVTDCYQGISAIKLRGISSAESKEKTEAVWHKSFHHQIFGNNALFTKISRIFSFLRFF